VSLYTFIHQVSCKDVEGLTRVYTFLLYFKFLFNQVNPIEIKTFFFEGDLAEILKYLFIHNTPVTHVSG